MKARLLIIQNGQRWVQRVVPLQIGQDGNVQTLEHMAQMVREDAAGDVPVRQVAQSVVESCPGHSFECEVERLYEFTRDRIRYVRDPVAVQRVADAATTLREGQGDCVDKSILLATMLGALGHRSRFVVLNFHNDVAQHGYDHVYVESLLRGEWIALDPTAELHDLGWSANGLKATFPIW